MVAMDTETPTCISLYREFNVSLVRSVKAFGFSGVNTHMTHLLAISLCVENSIPKSNRSSAYESQHVLTTDLTQEQNMLSDEPGQ